MILRIVRILRGVLVALVLALPLLAAAQAPDVEAPYAPSGVEVAVPEADAGAPVTPIALATAVTTLGTWALRRIMGEERLRGKPQILGWASVGLAVLGGAAGEVLAGSLGFPEALRSAALAWVSAQGLRRVKKLGGIA